MKLLIIGKGLKKHQGMFTLNQCRILMKLM